MEKYVICVNGEEREEIEAKSLNEAEQYLVKKYTYLESIYGDGSVELLKENLK